MAIDVDTLQALGLSSPVAEAAPKKKELGQDDFLLLLTTQMTNQDPTKPMENGDFLAQMAQFGTVEGINGLQDSFQEFAGSITSNQALQASSLIGKSVEFTGDSAYLDLTRPLSGSLALESSANDVSVNILGQNGELVKTINLGTQAAGSTKFSWDGLKDDGSYAPPGVYKIQAQGQVGGANTALVTSVVAKVDSVDLGDGQAGIALNLGQAGRVDFNQVKQILS